jgi:Zn-dependent protease with chaperone function
MDFFQQQDRARANTIKLIVLFALAVLGTLVAVNAVAYMVLTMVGGGVSADDRYRAVSSVQPEDPLYRFDIYGLVSLGTLLLIGGGSAYKTMSLSAGGPAVAEMLGGAPVARTSTDPQHRKLLNVVEEMAIASGVPVPQVYVMEDEPGINAFAAGKTFDDAVIGVTRGCIERLNRDELQGVIAHEFSHILNGDMRLNIRLIGIIHGILVIGLIGYGILRSLGRATPRRSSGKNQGGGILVILAVGVSLLIIGYLGMFFGRLIQAAVSRQREYLADASAVQFTRNPSGIANALKKIGGLTFGSRVENANAPEVQHMFFGSAVRSSFAGLLATHPPLDQRIRAIEPHWDGRFLTPADVGYDGDGTRVAVVQPRAAPAGGAAFGFAVGPAAAARTMKLDPIELVDQVAVPRAGQIRYAGALLTALPDTVAQASREPFSARAIIAALLLSDDPSQRQHQLALLQQRDAALATETARLAPDVHALGIDPRLPLIELTMSALRQLSPNQAAEFRAVMKSLIAADDRVTAFEYAVFRIVGRALSDSTVGRIEVAKYHSIKPLLDDAVRLLSALARRSRHDTARAFAAGAARLDSGALTLVGDAGDLKKLDESLNRLSQASPGVKRRIVNACGHVVAFDGEVSVDEAELLRAIAAVLGVPIPPFVPLGSAPVA